MKNKDLDEQAKLCYSAICRGNDDVLLELFVQFPEVKSEVFQGVGWLHHACFGGNLSLVRKLVSLGFDVNQLSGSYNSSPLGNAVGSQNREVVAYLLERGADPNAGRELVLACAKGNPEIVKLLVEHGADIHRVFGEKKEPRINALSQALAYGHSEIAEFLMSQGATEPELAGAEGEAQSWRRAIVAAMEKVYGKALAVAPMQIAPGKLPLSVHVIPPTAARATNILFTTGMSAKPIKVPKGMEKYQFAEICVELPADWPIRGPKSQEPQNNWPMQWLLQVANYPHANKTSLGAPVTIIANGEPPAPLAPNTLQSCLLLTAELLEVNSSDKKRPREIAMYRMFPLYREERELERKQGIAALGEAFDRANVGQVVDVRRKNVASV